MINPIGAVRTLDDVGRIVIPAEMRRTLNWEDRDNIEIIMDNNSIVLKKFEPVAFVEKIRVAEGLNMILDGLTESERIVVNRAIKFLDKY